MKRLRILHVIPSVSHSRGGPSSVVNTLAEATAARGCEVSVVATDDDGKGRLQVPLRQPVLKGDVTYWYFPRHIRFYTVSWPLRQWLRQNLRNYDVIHIHALFSYPSVVAARWAATNNVPFIVRPLGTLENWGLANRRPLLKKISLKLIEKRILRNAAAVQFTSQKEAEEADQLGVPHRSIVIPNPVELFRTTESLSPGSHKGHSPTILFLSRLDPKKGIDVLLAAFSELRRSGVESRLVIAGSGNPHFVESLKSRADRLSLTEHVEWMGHISGTKKRELLAQSDIFVLPSHSENFGVSAAEAMQAGIPVIISDNVGIKDIIEKNQAGLVVRAEASELFSAMKRLLEDDSFREKAGQRAQAVAEKEFAPDAVAKSLISLYEEVVSGSQRSFQNP